MIQRDAELHALGLSQFVDDLPLPQGTLFAQPVLAPVAHADLEAIDILQALACPGVIAVFTARDIPGRNQTGNVAEDEVLFASDEIVYHGQVVALVVAESPVQAREAAQRVHLRYQLLPAIFDVREADRLGQHIAPATVMACGDVASAWMECTTVVEGSASTGAQEHVYLETQCALAWPLDHQTLKVVSATQSPGMTQRVIARILGIAMHQIEVDVPRLGGGFGGKEEQATPVAAMAALAAWRLQVPVKLTLSREDDCRITGKRHPYVADFKLGLDDSGKILAYQVAFYQNAGAFADLSLAILDRTLFHAGNVYYIPHLQASAVSCRTHLPPNTAFRGFGAPQAMFVLEAALFEAAKVMGLDVSELQRRNLLQPRQHFHYGMAAGHCLAEVSWQQLHQRFALSQRQQAIDDFNARNVLQKKAMAVMPIAFGIAFTAKFLNQADALVHVYGDGSISISCGAVEMGQGVKQKLAKVAAQILGVDEQRIRVDSTNTSRVANMSPTAASTGADLNGHATRIACLQIRQRLLALAARLLGHVDDETLSLDQERVWQGGRATAIAWPHLVSQAYLSRTALSAQAHYATPELMFDRNRNQGQPFAYHVYGCAAVEVTLDTLRGRYSVVRVSIVHDAGQPLDETLDRGQVEGALLQGLGWMTLEQVLYDEQGRLMTALLSQYKIPDMHFAPEIALAFLKTDNPPGLLQSKAVGEPPLMYGIGAYFALAKAILAFNPHWVVDYRAPLTPERVLLALYGDHARVP